MGATNRREWSKGVAAKGEMGTKKRDGRQMPDDDRRTEGKCEQKERRRREREAGGNGTGT